MVTLQELEKRIGAIEKRNNRVEWDKRWETSWVRRIAVIMFTYVAIGLYLQIIHVANPWLNALVPAVGFFLSTLTLSVVKQYWMKGK
ncbi:MAG: hypothetical protein WAV51_03370 [Microgenomates group bacterium]